MQAQYHFATLKVDHVTKLVAQLERQTPSVLLFNANVICRVKVPVSLIPPGALDRQIADQ